MGNDRVVEHRLDVALAGDVASQRDRLAAGRVDERHGLGRRVGHEVGNRHARALSRHGERCGTADPTATTRHESRFAVEHPGHHVLPSIASSRHILAPTARQREGATIAMTCRWNAILAAALLGLMRAEPALADAASVRIVAAVDIAALPLAVAAHGHLIEQQAEARNLPGVTVQWLIPNGGNPIEQLLNGQADIVVATDIVGFLLAWDERSGTPQEIRGLAALAQMPYQLLSRNPAIHTIRDLSAKDRIAVPTAKTSLPAVMLEMAAADEWGAAHYDKLDPLTVTLDSDAADSALHSGKGNIDADFSRMPYADDERGDDAIHRVMDSFDIAGPHNVALMITTAQFRDANPALCE